MKSTLLFLGLGAQEVIILLFIFSPFLLRFLFYKELYKFFQTIKNGTRSDIPKYPYIIFIPVISFFYLFIFSTQVDKLISQTINKNFNRYSRICKYKLTILILYLLFFINNQYIYNSQLSIFYSVGFIIVFLVRITEGIFLYFTLRKLNKPEQ
jgi:hypothetical protein